MKSEAEMKEMYGQLYNHMATSNEQKYMELFGKVMTEMFNWFVENKPDAAEQWLCKLESIRWKNYLTHKEGEQIVAGMIPKAPWSFDVWKNAMTSYGLDLGEAPCYNKYALWVEMNKQYSDHAETVARDVLDKSLSEIPAQKMVEITYAFALDVLKDKDEVYSIREYFGL